MKDSSSVVLPLPAGDQIATAMSVMEKAAKGSGSALFRAQLEESCAGRVKRGWGNPRACAGLQNVHC